jgi:predicted amidophosphoribosyltransferase
MVRLALSSVILCCGCAAPAPDYRSIIACELAVASLEEEKQASPVQDQPEQTVDRPRWFRRR